MYPWKKELYLCADPLSLHSTREALEQTAGRCAVYTWSRMLSAWSGSKWHKTVHCSCSWNPRWVKGMQYGAPQPSATPADFAVSCQPELHHLPTASWKRAWETNILAHPASRIEARREEDYWWKGKLYDCRFLKDMLDKTSTQKESFYTQKKNQVLHKESNFPAPVLSAL